MFCQGRRAKRRPNAGKYREDKNMREEDAFPLGHGGLYEPLGSAQALGAPVGFAMCRSKWRPQEKYEVQGKR